MDIDLKKLNHVVTIARTGSFSRAADALHITQPALSRSVAAVEAHFGIRIFDRSRNGSVLTPVGQLAVQEAEALLRQARTLNRNLRLYREGHAGEIAFGLGPLVASLLLPGLSSHFMSRYPRLRIRTSIKPDRELHQELREDQIELLFCGQGREIENSDTVFEVVGQLPLAMLVRAGHPLAEHAAVTTADLLEFPLLSAVQLAHTTVADGTGAFICDNYDVLRTTVLHSDGIWMSSPLLVQQELQQGLLTKLEVRDARQPAQVDVYMARLRHSQPSPIARAIEEFVKGFFAGFSESL